MFSTFSILLQYNEKTQLLTTAARITIGSGTLIHHAFHNHFFDSPDCGILDAGLTDHCAVFVKLPFCCKTHDDTGTTYKNFPLICIENARKFKLELLSEKLKFHNI